MKHASIAHFAPIVFGLTVLASGCASEQRETKSATAETTSTRPTDTNKALVRKSFEDVWAKHDPESARKYFAADLVNHAAIPSAQGAEGMVTIAKKIQKAFPDITMSIERITADEDLVVVSVVFEGTQTQTLEFQKPIEATNKHVRLTQVHTYRVKEGRIVESWMVMDKLDMMTQLGQKL